MNDRQLDVWWMYKDHEAILSPLKIILGHKDEITKEDPLYLFVNCSSKFIVDGKEMRIRMSTRAYRSLNKQYKDR